MSSKWTKAELADLKRAMNRIHDFNLECEEEQHTDVGDAWDILGQAHDAIGALFAPRQAQTTRIVVCIDAPGDALEAYEQVYKAMGALETLTGLEWESSDEWFAPDGQQIEQDAIDQIRLTVLSVVGDLCDDCGLYFGEDNLLCVDGQHAYCALCAVAHEGESQ